MMISSMEVEFVSPISCPPSSVVVRVAAITKRWKVFLFFFLFFFFFFGCVSLEISLHIQCAVAALGVLWPRGATWGAVLMLHSTWLDFPAVFSVFYAWLFKLPSFSFFLTFHFPLCSVLSEFPLLTLGSHCCCEPFVFCSLSPPLLRYGLFPPVIFL